MCLVIYVAAPSPLPLIAWQENAPGFNVTELTPREEAVRRHLAFDQVRQAGSHTGCGCGFNEGREYPDLSKDAVAERAAALESSSQLARYVVENAVQQIYSCWSGDEGEAQVYMRRVKPDALFADAFFFRERELLIIARDAALRPHQH